MGGQRKLSSMFDDEEPFLDLTRVDRRDIVQT